MDPLRNPFSPGAGAPPPALAGRGFASAFKVSIGGVSIAVGEPPLADTGNLEVDLPTLLPSRVGKTFLERG